MPKNILITGGDGFIGSVLVKKLSKGNNVESFDIVRHSQDLRNSDSVRKAVEGKDAVFHLAAIADLNWARVHPLETMAINCQGTWNVAYACSQYKVPLYYASTCCVYGNQTYHPSTELTMPNPNEIYACSKLAGESIIKGFYYSYGMKYNMMRFATIYGEGTRPALATHIFLGQALRGEPITVHGTGKQTRTLTHIDDLIEAIMCLYKSNVMNDTWNMSTDEEVSAFQMAEDAKRLTKSKSKIVFTEQRIGQTFKESISYSKLKALGWSPKVKWNDGFQRMYEWFLKTHQVGNIYKLPR